MDVRRNSARGTKVKFEDLTSDLEQALAKADSLGLEMTAIHISSAIDQLNKHARESKKR